MFSQSLPLHPAVVHFPIALGILAPLVTLCVWIAIRRNGLTRRAWLIVMGIHLLTVGSGVISMKLGERDEDQVEKVVGKAAIHEHEEAAEAFVWTSGATLALSGVTFFVPGGTLLVIGRALTSVGSLIASGLVLNAGHSGGVLVYEKGAAQAYVGGASHD